MQEQSNKPKTERVIAYIDGFNLYFGMRDGFLDRFYWLDVSAMIQSILRPHQQLVMVKYFTARVSFPASRVKRQGDYLDALATRPLMKIFYGQYEGEEVACEGCGFNRTVHSEKMTDVNFALEITKDAVADNFDAAMLVTGDSDQTPTLRLLKELFPEKRRLCLFPPNRRSNRLKTVAHAELQVKNHMLSKSQLPDTVTSLSGVELRRPDSWCIEAAETRRVAKAARSATTASRSGTIKQPDGSQAA